MLRIIIQPREARAELQRIRHSHKLGKEEMAYEADLRAKTATVQDILLKIQQQGDQGMPAGVSPIRISSTELDAAYQKIPQGLVEALRSCCRQLAVFYQQRIPKAWVHFAEDEGVLGRRYHPVKRAGFYAENVGSLLTQAIPAQVAKVPQRIMVTPLDSKHSHYFAVLVAAQEVGIQEIYHIDGAAAIAALAYGTETIPPVEVITGAGDWEVTLAKKLVNGVVTIDTPIERTDLVIIADRTAKDRYIAADLIAQAEQYPTSALVLLTDDLGLAQRVQQRILDWLPDSPSSILTEKALAHYGLIVVVDSLTTAIQWSEEIQPYFLLLSVAEPWDWVDKIQQARAIFLGQNTPKATGDYLGGSSLIYPASGHWRHGATISIETFLKPTNLIQYSPDALQKLSYTLALLAQAEGLLTKEETIKRRVED